MARLPLFGTEQTGKAPRITAQERINVYAEPRPEDDRTRVSYHQRPGLTAFKVGGAAPARGMRAVDDTLYVVRGDTLYSLDNAAVETAIDTIGTSTGRVDMSDNGAEVLIVDGTATGYIYDIVAGTLTAITDNGEDYFPGADTCGFQGGRFLVNKPDTGEFYISASYDGTTWDALDFATAESFPDNLVRVYVEQGEVILFGETSMEVWSNIGALDFPYSRIDGSTVEWGLAARWSVASFGNTIAWLAKNRTGQVQVVRLNGYAPQVISNPELDGIINSYNSVSGATGLTYTAAGHTFFQLNFPDPQVSWVFDLQSGLWLKFEYGALGARHRSEIAAEFITRTVVSDYANGNLYNVSAEAYCDNGVAFARQLQSRHVFNEEYISIGRLWVDMQTGVGTPSGAGENPQMMLQVSKDGGSTWGPERWTDIGREGRFSTRAQWRTLGRAYEWTFRLRNADDIKLAIAGAWVDGS